MISLTVTSNLIYLFYKVYLFIVANLIYLAKEKRIGLVQFLEHFRIIVGSFLNQEQLN